MNNPRHITYGEALNEALTQEMKRDESIFVYGLDVADHKRILGTTNNLVETFGKDRCMSMPLSEEALTGFGLGAAISGLKPVMIHIRVEFMLLAMNQLVNMVAAARYGSAGKLAVPFVIRSTIGRGWGQGFQHSKSLQSIFAHIPGLKVVMPTTPHDAKGLTIAALRDNNPVIILEHRWLYWQEGEVPKEAYEVPIGKAIVRREGSDVTVVATSWMGVEARHAAEIMARHGVSVEVIDPRSITPFDEETVIESVKKTKHCVVADYDWAHCGFSAEVAARVSQKCFKALEAPVERVAFPETHCPTTRPLEDEFYPNAKDIIRAIERTLERKPIDLGKETFYSYEKKFKGPF